MSPHRFEYEGEVYDIEFEHDAEGWIARIRHEGSEAVQVVAFPEKGGFDPSDVRGSLIAGCEAFVTRIPAPRPTRH